MFSCLLSNTLLAAGAALLVWAVARWLKPAPATLHALWVVVLLKLLSPFGLVYPLPLGIESRGEAPAPAKNAEPAMAMTEVEVTEEFFLASVVGEAADVPPATAAPEPAAPEAAPTPEPARAASGPGVLRLLLLIWAGGAACVLARQFWQTAGFARRARRARPAPEGIANHVARLARRLGVRPPAVRVLPGLASPVVFALGRPVLLWPAGLEDRLADGGRDAVLLHELAHLRRGDHWTRWLELAAAVVHWWNPLFWLARRQVRFQAELACDAWVTGCLPGGRRAYAEALLEVCSTVSRAAAPSPAVGVGGDGRRDFQRRLTMIMREQVPCRPSGRGKLAVALLAAAVLPGWVLAQEEKPPAAEEEVQVILVDGAAADPQEAKLKELEAKIAALTKELHALRAGKPAAPAADKVPARVEIRRTETRPLGVELSKPGAPPAAPVAAREIKVIVIDSASGKIIKEYTQGAPATPAVPATPATPATPAKPPLPPQPGQAPQGGVLWQLTQPQADAVKKAETARTFEIDVRKKAEVAQADALKKLGEARGKLEWQLQNLGETVRVRSTGGAPAQASVIMLSRATYRLPREKAEALAAFIKQHVQATVLELKAEADGLTVTTTPEVQQALGTLVKLMAAKPAASARPPQPGAPIRIQLGTPPALNLENIQLHVEPLHLDGDQLKLLTEPLQLDGAGLKLLLDKVQPAPAKPKETGDILYRKVLPPGPPVAL